MPPTRSTLNETLQQFMSGYGRLDAEAIIGLRSPKCIHKILPNSTKSHAMTNQEYAQYLKTLVKAWQEFLIHVHGEVFDCEARTIVCWGSGKAKTVIGDFSNEYMFWIQTNEDGTLIDEIKEFVDSTATLAYFGRLKAHLRDNSKL